MEEGHAADRRGFGAAVVGRRRGFGCRYDCGRYFSRENDDVSMVALRGASKDRDKHELDDHGATFVPPPPLVLARKRRWLYGKAVGAE